MAVPGQVSHVDEASEGSLQIVDEVGEIVL